MPSVGSTYHNIGESGKAGAAAVSLASTGLSGTNPGSAGSLVTIASVTLPANALNVNGKGVRIRAWFSTAANVNSKSANIKFGATVLATATTTTSAQGLIVEAVVVRRGAASQEAAGVAIGSVTAVSVAALTETLTSDVVIAFQANVNPTTDIALRGYTVDVFGEGTAE